MWVKRKLCSLERIGYDYTKYNESFMKKILGYAQKHVPYYQKKHFNNLKEFPIVGKEDIRGKELMFQSDRKKYLVHKKLTTGGSTGEPFGFLISPQFDDVFQEFLWKLYDYKEGDTILDRKSVV